MKKTLVAFVAILFLCSCGGMKYYTGYYNISLSEVENPVNPNDRFGEIKLNKVGDNENEAMYNYADSLIDITWTIGNTKFGFLLKNKSDNSIKIIWDDAVFIDTDGSSNRVMHAGIKYNEKGNPQAPSVIARHSFLKDMVLPTKNVYYESNPYIAGWKEKFYLPVRDTNKELLKNSAASYNGEKIKIILPIQIQNTVNDYGFTFNIGGFTLVN